MGQTTMKTWMARMLAVTVVGAAVLACESAPESEEELGVAPVAGGVGAANRGLPSFNCPSDQPPVMARGQTPPPPSASPSVCTGFCSWNDCGTGCECPWQWHPAGWDVASNIQCPHSFPVPRNVNGVWRCYAW